MIRAHSEHMAPVPKQDCSANTAVAAATTSWNSELPPPASVDASSGAVQLDFMNLNNAENLFRLLQANAGISHEKCADVICASIVCSVQCLVSDSKRSEQKSEDNFFIEFADATAGFLRAGPVQKAAMLASIVKHCEQFAERLHDRLCVMRAEQALLPDGAPLTAQVLRDQQILHVYSALLAETDRLRDLRRHQAQAKADYERVRAHQKSLKLDLFCRALKQTPAKCAPLDPTDAACHVCGLDYTADGAVQRITLACCMHKQSICRQCFAMSSFEKSDEGIKSFANCPFCRTEYTLYEAKSTGKRRFSDDDRPTSRARRNLHFSGDNDNGSSSSASPSASQSN